MDPIKLKDIPIPFARNEMLYHIIPGICFLLSLLPFVPVFKKASVDLYVVLSDMSWTNKQQLPGLYELHSSESEEEVYPEGMEQDDRDRFRHSEYTSQSVLYHFLPSEIKRDSPFVQITLLMAVMLLFLVAAYCCGHIISTIAIFILERLILARNNRYPIVNMLNNFDYYSFIDETGVKIEDKEIICGSTQTSENCACHNLKKQKCKLAKILKKPLQTVKIPWIWRRLPEFLNCPVFPACFSKGEIARFKITTTRSIMLVFSCFLISMVFGYMFMAFISIIMIIFMIFVKQICIGMIKLCKRVRTDTGLIWGIIGSSGFFGDGLARKPVS